MKLAVVAIALLMTSLPAAAQTSDSAAVVDVVDRFHNALATGDSTTVLALLAPDVIILEAGGVETRDEYRSHHLPGDIAFARAVPGERKIVRVSIVDRVAWVSSTSVARGTYRDRPIDSIGAELVVLTKTLTGWRISAIHWSARRRS